MQSNVDRSERSGRSKGKVKAFWIQNVKSAQVHQSVTLDSLNIITNLKFGSEEIAAISHLAGNNV